MKRLALSQGSGGGHRSRICSELGVKRPELSQGPRGGRRSRICSCHSWQGRPTGASSEQVAEVIYGYDRRLSQEVVPGAGPGVMLRRLCEVPVGLTGVVVAILCLLAEEVF